MASTIALGERFQRVLNHIVEHADHETDWLDMLSQLEYVGCRKILKAVPYEQVGLEVLQHMAEEASHAYLLKAVVEARAAGRDWTNNPLSEIGWRYFQTLDHEITQLLQAQGAALSSSYPAVSWAVESRVLAVYPAYIEATKSEPVQRALGRILAQERRHGGQFEAVQYAPGLREAMLAIEARLWDEFTEDLESHFALDDATERLPLRFQLRQEFAELRATD